MSAIQGKVRLRWLGPVQRRKERDIGRRVRRIEAAERKRKRSKRSYKDAVKEDTKAAGVKVKDADENLI